MDFEKLSKKLTDEESNDEYIGNMWGWKFSFFGLFLIVTMSIVTWYSNKTGRVNMSTGEPVNKSQPANKPIESDSITIK